MKSPLRSMLWALLLCLAFTPVAAPFGTLPSAFRVVAQSAPPIEYERYDVDLTLQDDGDLHVRIQQRVAFEGEFERAFLEIPRDFTAEIHDISVRLVDAGLESPANADVSEGEDAVTIEWTYPRTTPGDSREFVIDYTVSGGLWVYSERDIVRWDAIHADRSGVPVRSSQVTVHLPAYVPLDAAQASAFGVAHAITKTDDAIIFTAQDVLPDGQSFNVQIDFPHGLVNANVQDWQKAEDTALLAVDMSRLAVDAWIKRNGTLVVREEIELAVQTGVLYDVNREIKRLYLDDVTHLRVTQDGNLIPAGEPPCEACLVLTTAPRQQDWVRYNRRDKQIELDESRTGYVRADWSLPPVSPGQSTTFAVEYVVLGAIRQDPDGQSFHWQGIPDFGVQPRTASLRVFPPEGLAVHELTVASLPQGVSLQEDPQGFLLLETGETLPTGELWDLRISMPPGAVDRTVPQWQIEYQKALTEQAAAQVAQARRRLALAVTGLFGLVLLLLLAILAWFKWGRRQVREMLGGYTSEPPSGLSPGIVAYLVDRSVRSNSLLASLLQLGMLGLIEIDLRDGLALRLVRTSEVTDAELRKLSPAPQSDPNTHLAYLFNRIILPAGRDGGWIGLSDLNRPMRERLPEFYSAMAFDAQAYLVRKSARANRLQVGPAVLMTAWLATAAAIIYGTFSFEIPSSVSILLVALAFAVFFVLHVLRELNSAGSYTDRGAAERAAWLKFRNYLTDLRKYGDLGTARRALERHFAYAVALDVQDIVLKQAAERGMRPPSWLHATPPTPQPSTGSTLAQSPQPHSAAGAHPRPGVPSSRPPLVRNIRPATRLAALSRSAGDSLAKASSSLAELLGTAAGDGMDGAIQVTLKNAAGDRSLTWDNGTSFHNVLDDIFGQTMADTRRELEQTERRNTARSPSSNTRASSARSSGSFNAGPSSFRSSSGASSSSTSRSSAGGGRSGGAGRSGFS